MILSASRIRNYMHCPMQMKLAQDHPDVEGVQHAKTSFGTIVHAALELYNNPGGTLEEATGLFLHAWEQPEILDLPPIDEWAFGRGLNYGSLRERGVQILHEYHEKNKWEGRLILGTEHKFCVPIGDHHLRGFVDLVEVKNSNRGKPIVRIVDFKTTSKQPTVNELQFDVQFTTYMYASLQREFWVGSPEFDCPGFENGEELYENYRSFARRAIWYHLWGNKEIDAGGRGDADFMRLYRCITAIVDAIEKEVYVPDISAATCGFCPYAEFCPVMIPVLDKLNQSEIEKDEESF